MLNRIVFLPIILAVSCVAGPALGSDLNAILDSLFARQARKYEAVKTLVYLGNSTYRELNDDGSVKKETVSERVIYQRGREQQSERYLSMSVNGKALSNTEMNNEVADWQKKGRRRSSGGSAKMPFYPEMRADYEYELEGSDTLDGFAAWKIGFKPKSPSSDHFTGTLWVAEGDFEMIRMESRPAKAPGVVKKMDLTMTFAPEQGCWLPRSFQMAAKIKVRFLVTLANVNFTVDDRYSLFSVNQEIPDSMFRDQK